jgi:hypothetical protein
MNTTKIIRITNKVALYSVGLLVYWVFIFVCITVFDFKIFKENITQAFYLSILGIFAILGGSIVLNIMLNMTKIAEHVQNQDAGESLQRSNRRKWIAVVSFPVILILLLLGDHSSSLKKKNVLISSGESLITEHMDSIEKIANYEFSNDYVNSTYSTLKLLSKVDESFPQITLILRDQVDGKTVLLGFAQQYFSKEEDYHKVDYIFSTSKEERDYLNSVFDGKISDYNFSAHDGNYELYFPVKTKSRVIVMYLSDRQRYGRMGS